MREVIARELMEDFAGRTGIVGNRPPNRYLWTDAFGVCTFLGLAEATGNQWYATRAEELVDQVHHTLGRHRHDDDRQGWISGLDDDEGQAHPTAGGLRIGKPRPERAPQERFDERGEWQRDGQYFHYLTRWMHALNRMAEATGEPTYHRWACELAQAGCDAFVYRPAEGGPARMYWKKSIDLSRPLIHSMGQHDPLDGYVTCLQLRATAQELDDEVAASDLGDQLDVLSSMFGATDWSTDDPLGIGGLLIDATRLQQLRRAGQFDDQKIFDQVVDAACAGLNNYLDDGGMDQPPDQRIAFRELGLAIGLEGIRLAGVTDSYPQLQSFVTLADGMVEFWGQMANQQTGNWKHWQDINDVMLACALAPEGFFGVQPEKQRPHGTRRA